MKKIMFITAEYYPISNGTVSCIENIVQELSRDNEVVIFTTSVMKKTNKEKEIKNTRVVRFNNFFDKIYYLRSNFVRNLSNKLVVTQVRSLVRFLTSPIAIANRYLSNSRPKVWGKNLIRHIRAHENIDEFDSVMAIGAPFISIECAVAIKKRFNIRNLILLEFDLYTDNPNILFTENYDPHLRSLRLIKEMSWYSIADKIIVLEEMYQTIVNSELKQHVSKVQKSKIPNLIDIKRRNNRQVFNSENINVVYTGTFYKNIRNPMFTLNLFQLLNEFNKKFKFHIYSRGCESIVKEFEWKLNGNLIYYGYLGKEDSDNAIFSADILVNISNNTTSQAPSKIIEYISSGKPIINIYTEDFDVSANILKKYPLSISIKEDFANIEALSNKILRFIHEANGKKMEFEDILESYSEYSPVSFTELIIEIIND